MAAAGLLLLQGPEERVGSFHDCDLIDNHGVYRLLRSAGKDGGDITGSGFGLDRL